MAKLIARVVPVALFLFMIPGISAAEVLASRTLEGGGTLRSAEHRVHAAFGYEIGNYATQRVLFDDTWLDSTSVGSVLVATAASDTDFAAIAQRLTDGILDYVYLGTWESGFYGAIGGEGAFFGLTTTDLGPATVEAISLRIDALSFGLDPRFQQPIVLYTFTVTVEGQRTLVPVRTASWGGLKAAYR